MAMRYFVIGFSLLCSLGAFILCRQSSSYFDKSRVRAFIKIKSDLICFIFISQSIKAWHGGHPVQVAPQNEHKISLIGLLAHLIAGSLCIRLIYLSIQYGVFSKVTALDPFWNTVDYLAIILCIVGGMTAFNNSKVA